MSLLQVYLKSPKVQQTLNKKPSEKGFSLIELVVVIAVLAVLTAIALPNFLGVSDDASARTAQQGVLNAYKECKVFWARNKRSTDEEFVPPAITDWAIASDSAATTQPKAGDTGVKCFDSSESSLPVFAIPKDTDKFPTYTITADGERLCELGGDSTTHDETYAIGCDEDATPKKVKVGKSTKSYYPWS